MTLTDVITYCTNISWHWFGHHRTYSYRSVFMWGSHSKTPMIRIHPWMRMTHQYGISVASSASHAVWSALRNHFVHLAGWQHLEPCNKALLTDSTYNTVENNVWPCSPRYLQGWSSMFTFANQQPKLIGTSASHSWPSFHLSTSCELWPIHLGSAYWCCAYICGSMLAWMVTGEKYIIVSEFENIFF